MSDIAERLRQGVDPDDIQETEATMDKGADEIERLTVALRWVELASNEPGVVQKARAALEGKP